MNHNLPDNGSDATNNMDCKRKWREIDDRSSHEIIIIDDDSDSDSYTAKPISNNSIGTETRYLHNKMKTDLAPTSEITSSDTPAEYSSIHPPHNDEDNTGMSLSERKRFREKKRRYAITSAVNNLSKTLVKVDRNSLVDRNGTPFGYQSSLSRTSTINRAARVLETLIQENEQSSVQITKLTALLRNVSNGSVQFERTRPLQPQIDISQYLSTLLSSTQQLVPQPQPAPLITVRPGLDLQVPPQNGVPLSMTRSTHENLLALQRRSEDMLMRRNTPSERHVSRGIQLTSADTGGGRS